MKASTILSVLFLACAADAFTPVSNSRVTHKTISVQQQQPPAAALYLFGRDKAGDAAVEDPPVEDKEANQMDLMSKIRDAGAAGAVSLFLWELAFWAISIPVAIVAFVQLNGSFPDFGNSEDVAKVGAEAFAFANVARFALPVRIGLAVSTTPWVKDNIVDAPWAQQFFNKKEEEA